MQNEPMTHPSRPGEADQADLQAFASYVHTHLDAHLTAVVEYRTDAANDNQAPQTHAIESLEVWKAWTSAFGADATQPAQLGKRLVRVSAAGAWLHGTLDRFGTDIGHLDAVALRTSFGTLCPWGTLSRYNECVDFDDRERGAEFYANWSVDALLCEQARDEPAPSASRQPCFTPALLHRTCGRWVLHHRAHARTRGRWRLPCAQGQGGGEYAACGGESQR